MLYGDMLKDVICLRLSKQMKLMLQIVTQMLQISESEYTRSAILNQLRQDLYFMRVKDIEKLEQEEEVDEE